MASITLKDAAVWAAWWILWRRIAAGLDETAHAALFAAIEPHLRPAPKGRVANPGKRPPGLAVTSAPICESGSITRFMGRFDRLASPTKVAVIGCEATRPISSCVKNWKERDRL